MEIQNIKKVRKQLGLTQSGLAKESNVSQSLIAKIESGNLDPAYSNAKKIFKALNTISEKIEMKADDIAQPRIISVRPDSDIKSAIRLMKKHNISQLPVVEDNNAVGMLSESIILDAVMDNKKGCIREIMKDSPPVISGTASVQVVSGLLKFFPIVLVSKKGRLNGVITKSDLLEKLR